MAKKPASSLRKSARTEAQERLITQLKAQVEDLEPRVKSMEEKLRDEALAKREREEKQSVREGGEV